MNTKRENVRTGSFWGRYILDTTVRTIEGKQLEKSEERKNRIHLAKLYEMVDDYVEQA